MLIKLQAIVREHLFYGISPDGSSTRYLPEELFRKFLKIFRNISKKRPLKKSCFNDDGDSGLVNLLKTQSYGVKTMTFVTYTLNIISLT